MEGQKTARLIRRYRRCGMWERAGLYRLDPPIPQLMRDGTHEHYEYVLVEVQGDTADMLASNAKGELTGYFARWQPLTRDDMEPRGLFMVDKLSCTGALEAEGYSVKA